MRRVKGSLYRGGFGFFIFPLAGFFLLATLVPSPGFCEELLKEQVSAKNVFRLGEVVVSADKETKETPSSITVITAEDIEKYNATNLGEAFRVIPGMLFRQTRTKNEYYVSMRGFDQENILILLDGVPINVPYEGLVNLADIPTQNIAEIKVIKGNSSVLYGPNAMGGVINIITKRGTDKPSFSALYQISDYNTHQMQATHGWKIGKFGYFIGASHKESDGFKLAKEFRLPADVTTSMANAPANPATPKNTPIAPNDGRRENSDYNRNALTFTGSYDITPNDKVGLSYEYYKHEYGVPPVPIFRETKKGFYYFPRYWRFSDWERYTTNLIEESQLSEHLRIKGRLFYDVYKNTLDAYDDNTYSSQNRIGGPPSGKSVYDDYSRGGNIYTFWDGVPRHNVRLGLSFKEDVHREQFKTDSEDRLSSYTYSIGLEDQIRILDSLALTVGASYDAFEKRERQQASVPNAPTGNNISAFNPMVGLSYTYSPALNIYGSIAKKVRFPTMRNLYGSGVIGPLGNPDLAEERSYNYEIGSRFSFAKKFVLESAIFYSDVSNMISFDNQIGRFEQYEKASLAGIELGLSGQFNAKLYGKISYTYLQARTNSTVTLEKEIPSATNLPLVYSPDELPYRPEHKIDLELSQKFDFGMRVDFNGSYVSKKAYYDHADAATNTLVAKKQYLDGYVLMNLKVSQNIGQGFQVFVAADNILNENYQDIYQLPAMGRTVWSGIKYDL